MIEVQYKLDHLLEYLRNREEWLSADGIGWPEDEVEDEVNTGEEIPLRPPEGWEHLPVAEE